MKFRFDAGCSTFVAIEFYMSPITLVIHGGAGTILKSLLTPELETRYKFGLQAALNRGYAVLENGRTALDAVEAAVFELENNPLFNAAKGAVFTHTGEHEMDASIMEGLTLDAGAVAGVKSVKNPIHLARKIMEQSGHVMLSGDGALEFAQQQGLDIAPSDYFHDDFRYAQWQEIKHSDQYQLDHSDKDPIHREKKFGTVGAVALDQFGNVAAATSTGGMTNKKYGRVGDTPLIGSGTYANNQTCAISCTGHGEYFIRAVVAYDISCLMEYKGFTLQQAMDRVILDKLVKLGGEGGAIGVAPNGDFSLTFNSDGMYRGVRNQTGLNQVAIYGND